MGNFYTKGKKNQIGLNKGIFAHIGDYTLVTPLRGYVLFETKKLNV